MSMLKFLFSLAVLLFALGTANDASAQIRIRPAARVVVAVPVAAPARALTLRVAPARVVVAAAPVRPRAVRRAVVRSVR